MDKAQQSARELENLCRPVLICLCNYWQYVHAGNPLKKEKFQADIELLMEEAREKAGRMPEIAGEYGRIERALVFFIDYMVKEGNFPFSKDWAVLARKYNELSGDEKFFDLLTETLNDPGENGAVSLFYVMMGLGFDGMYRGDPDFIVSEMRRSAGVMDEFLDIKTDPLTPLPETKKALVKPWRGFVRGLCCALALSALFFLISLGVNAAFFGKATLEFRQALAEAFKSAQMDSVPAGDKTDTSTGEAK